LDRIIKIKNGDRLVDFKIYRCDKCGCEVKESDYAYFKKNITLCRDCAFINGYFSSKEYLESVGIGLSNFHVGINQNREIEIWQGKATPPWERKSKEQRHIPQYENWRTEVFERDEYTCQKCGQRGGRLNAHHIKPFAKFKKLRYVVNNGLTLCEKCHKKVHKKKKR